jgi:NDP-4-keto-2,6-dideoxyhexose 3-C-methyltransferase
MLKEIVDYQHHTTRETCRVCGSPDLTPLFSLGDIYVSTFVDKRDSAAPKCPLELVFCENCTLVQLKHTAPQELLYSRHYWYRSGINPVITSDLKEIAKVASKIVDLDHGDIVLDIGANDGTLLKNYPGKVVRVGCEPATNLVSYLKRVTPWVIDDFWSEQVWKKMFGDKKAKIVTAIGMFYDMEDPNEFINDVAKVLDKEGIFVAQLMCLKSMLEKNDLGNICHEHLEYYSYRSLKYLFEANGLEIFKVEENEINGGSYRLFARHLKEGSLLWKENCSKSDIKDFYKRIQFNKEACMKFIQQEVKKGKKVYAYGASTKGNTLLQYYGLNNKVISAAADKDPRKWGKLTVGTWVPIVSEPEARRKADYFFVLPWAFWRTFLEREKKWLKKGGKFVIPLPHFRVVGDMDDTQS